MKTKIVKTTITTMNEDRVVESTSSSESFVLEADPGKVLKNITTGAITRSLVCVTKKAKIAEYIEIADLAIVVEVGPQNPTSTRTLK